MWGSWLDQIQRKLDDVSGLAERVVGVEYHQGEQTYSNEQGVTGDEKEEGVREGADNTWADQYNHIMAASKEWQQQKPNKKKKRKFSDATSHLRESGESGRAQVLQNATPKMGTDALSDDNHNVSTHSTLLEETPKAKFVDDAAAEPIVVKSILTESTQVLPATLLQEVATSVANDSLAATSTSSGRSSDTLVAVNTVDSVNHNAPHGNKPSPELLHDKVFQHPNEDADGSEGQLLRLQRLLAEEMEAARVLRKENQHLLRSKIALEEEVASLRQLMRSADDAQKLEALEQEGIELSMRLGKERERNKLLQETKMKLDERILSLEGRIAHYVAKEAESQRALEVIRAERDAMQQLTKELNMHQKEQENRVLELQQLLSDAKRSHTELVAQHEERLSRQKAELAQERDSTSDLVESLRRENSGLVSELQRSHMEYERRIQEIENKLFQANHRADSAETRLTEHERGSLAPLRELRMTLDCMEQQRKRLMDEAAYAAEECAALKRSRIADNEEYMHRLSELQTEVHTLREEKLRVEQELHLWMGKESQVQRALQEALERASNAQAMNDHLTALLEEARRYIEGLGSGENKNAKDNVIFFSGPSSDAVREPTQMMASLTPLVEGGGMQLYPLQVDKGEAPGDAGRGGRGRVERELVRQAVEIERLRSVETEAAETKQRLSSLATQHDLLMQLYGQLQEEFQKLQQQGSQHVR